MEMGIIISRERKYLIYDLIFGCSIKTSTTLMLQKMTSPVV